MLELYRQEIRMANVKDRLFVPFWRMSFDAALEEGDRATALRVVDEFEKLGASKRLVAVIAKTMRADLEALPED